MKSYRDYSLGAKERASLLLKEMSLDEKMAQITLKKFSRRQNTEWEK